MKGFSIEGLTGDCLKVAKIVRKVVGTKASDGGCQPFYTPQAWEARGEKYGTGSVLVLVHDGGDLAPFCNYDYEQYDRIEKFSKALAEDGFYVENCTSWYSAVYRINQKEE